MNIRCGVGYLKTMSDNDQISANDPTPEDDATNASDLSLLPVLETFADNGWSANHLTRPNAEMKCGGCGETTNSSELEAVTVHRIEGASDPDDMQMVLGIECPRCGDKGVLVVGYGPNASEQDAAFLLELGMADAVEMIMAQPVPD
jgi:DNA-directed RNA polymerase subunit RPC12/RpoP